MQVPPQFDQLLWQQILLPVGENVEQLLLEHWAFPSGHWRPLPTFAPQVPPLQYCVELLQQLIPQAVVPDPHAELQSPVLELHPVEGQTVASGGVQVPP